MGIYYHKTSGGAEYLCKNYILCSNGHKEGVFPALCRVDGGETDIYSSRTKISDSVAILAAFLWHIRKYGILGTLKRKFNITKSL